MRTVGLIKVKVGRGFSLFKMKEGRTDIASIAAGRAWAALLLHAPLSLSAKENRACGKSISLTQH
eukprot:scaffold447_cov112-Skeletonema_dohrnii-CCMP3373.AAC.2